MSLWDRFGEVWDDVQTPLAGFVFDVVRVMEDTGVATDAARLVDSEYRPPAQAAQGGAAMLEGLDWGVSTLVKRPVSTTHQVISGQGRRPGETGFAGSAFDPDMWRRAWNESETLSAGQALASTAGVGQMSFNTDPTKMTPQEREVYFSEDTRARIFSGTVDAALYIPDPLVGAGHLASTVRAARATVRAEDVSTVFASDAALRLGDVQLTGRQARQRAIVDDFIRATEGRTVSELAQSDMFRQSTDAGALAYWFGRANEIGDEAVRLEAKRDILAIAFGDRAAAGRLRAHSATLADEVEMMSSQIEELELARMFATPGGLDFSDALAVANDPAKIERLERQRDQIEQAIHQARRLAGEGGSSVGIAGQLTRLRPNNERNYARVAQVIHDGIGTNPIHVITGRRIPGIFRASDYRAGDIMRDVLARAHYLPVERRRDLLDKFTVATPKERATLAIQAENEIFRAAAKQFAPGMTRGQLESLLQHTRGRRAAYLRQLKSRAYGSVDTDNYVPLIDEDGNVLALDRQLVDDNISDVPMLAAQLTDQISIVDPKTLEQVLRRYGRNGMAGYLTRVGEDTWEVAEHGLAVLNRLWKFSALFRLAYPVRVQVDTQMRLMAALGAMRYAALATQGTKHFLGSLTHARGAERRALTERIGLARLDEASRERLLKVEERLAANPTSEALKAEKARIISAAGGETLRTSSGQLIDATPYRDLEEFERISAILSPEDSIGRLMTDSMTQDLRQLRASGAWDKIDPNRPEWMSSYLRVVNQQFRNDPVALKMIAGESDDAILRWLRTSADGRQHWRLLRAGYGSPELLLQRVRANLDELLPVDSGLRAAASTRAIREADVNQFWRHPADRPPVRGEILTETSLRNTVGQYYDDLTRKWYNFASTMPEQILGRHPLYVARFREHFATRVARAETPDGKLSLQQVEELRRQASQMAQRDVAETLFDLFRQGNTAHAMRFVSPFFSAWEDTMTKWGKLIGGDPGLAPRLYQLWGAPNNAGLVVDENGNRVKKNGDVVDDDGNIVGHKAPFAHGQYIILPLGWSGAGIGSLRVSKTSFNIVFQGDPFYLPGPGPMAAVPVNTLAAGTFPEFMPFSEDINSWGPAHADNPVTRWALPFGAEKEGSDALVRPAWVDRLWALWQGEDSPDFAATYQQLYAEEQNRIRLGLRPEVSEEELTREVQNKVRNWYIMRFLVAEASPVSITPQSPLQFYLEEYRRYRREFPGNAEEKFREDYPEYYEMAISLSQSNTGGLNATVEAWEGIQDYRARAAKFPEYSWAYAGAANVGGEFSDSVYAAQFNQRIGPGTSKRFREPVDPAEQARRVQAGQGWHVYRAGITELNLELERRGLTSFSSKGAEDLALSRRTFVENLKQENEAWAQEFGDKGSGSVEQFLRWAQGEARRDKKLAARPDFQRLNEYMIGRQEIQAALAQRRFHGIDHPTNADLRLAWDTFTQQLISSDIGFEQMWIRELQHDDLTSMKPLED